MKIRDLLARLQMQNPDADVKIEGTPGDVDVADVHVTGWNTVVLLRSDGYHVRYRRSEP